MTALVQVPLVQVSLVQILEERLANAWPALDVRLADGWMLRFADGYSKRANAASAIRPGATLDDALIDHVVAQYREAGLPAVFRLTGIESLEVDARLAARGFAEIEPSLGLVAAIEPGPLDPDLHHAPAADRDWIAAAAEAYGGDKADAGKLGAIVARIRPPAAFATLGTTDGTAWGLAVAERGYVGLYDLVVAPGARGRGLGRRLVRGLLAWGAAEGARHAYLQVRDTNAAAIALYRSMGFRDAYTYRHRVRD